MVARLRLNERWVATRSAAMLTLSRPATGSALQLRGARTRFKNGRRQLLEAGAPREALAAVLGEGNLRGLTAQRVLREAQPAQPLVVTGSGRMRAALASLSPRRGEGPG